MFLKAFFSHGTERKAIKTMFIIALRRCELNFHLYANPGLVVALFYLAKTGNNEQLVKYTAVI